MAAKALTAQSLHMDIQIGIFTGFGWTHEETAKHLGCTAANISIRRQNPRHRSLIDTIAEYTAVGVARLTSERLLKAEEDFTERKKRLHTKGYKMIEKVIDKGLQDEAEIDTLHLRAAEMGIERNEGKPLDRKAIMTRNENVTMIQVDGDELDDILGEIAQINELRRSALQITDGSVKDAELV